MVSGTVERWLQKDAALRVVYSKLEPALMFTDYVTLMKEDTNGFMYSFDSGGMSGDSKKEQPPIHASGAKFPELDISRESVASALTQENGFSLRVPRDVIKSAGAVNYIQKCYKRAGFWMAEWIDNQILSVYTGNATTPTWTPNAVWSAGTATPVDDLIALGEQMDREGYPYRMSDIFVHKTNWYELKRYLTSVDIGDLKQKTMYGIPEVTKDIISVPIVDSEVHKVMSGLSEGYILAIDRNNLAVETHYYNDPEFSQPVISYPTVVDGKSVTKTVKNLGVHFKQYKEEESNDTILQFWCDQKSVMTQAYAALYGSGI